MAVNQIYEEIRNESPLETGGCLLGYWDESFKEVVIEECIGPGPMAKHSKYGFEPDSEWQELQIARIYKDSGFLRTYLGDWHSHPQGKLTLSWKDKRTLLRIAKFSPARAPHPLMVVMAGPPWRMRIWKTDKIRRFSFKLDTSECETIEY